MTGLARPPAYGAVVSAHDAFAARLKAVRTAQVAHDVLPRGGVTDEAVDRLLDAQGALQLVPAGNLEQLLDKLALHHMEHLHTAVGSSIDQALAERIDGGYPDGLETAIIFLDLLRLVQAAGGLQVPWASLRMPMALAAWLKRLRSPISPESVLDGNAFQSGSDPAPKPEVHTLIEWVGFEALQAHQPEVGQ